MKYVAIVVDRKDKKKFAVTLRSIESCFEIVFYKFKHNESDNHLYNALNHAF